MSDRPKTEALDDAESIGGPSQGYERPDDLSLDSEEDYEERDEEPSGLEGEPCP